jgi:hypothetical protein
MPPTAKHEIIIGGGEGVWGVGRRGLAPISSLHDHHDHDHDHHRHHHLMMMMMMMMMMIIMIMIMIMIILILITLPLSPLDALLDGGPGD